jgi:hypothetical protein
MATSEHLADLKEAAELTEARRLKSLEYEANALDYGDNERSMRHMVARMLCAGGVVKQSEGGDMTAERSLMRFASATTKALGIALAHFPMVEDRYDAAFDYAEAATVLIGLSEMLAAAPVLLDKMHVAGLDVRSGGETRHRDEEGAEEGEVEP